MSVAIVYSRAQVGIEAPLVTIEVHLSNGLPGLSIVGLPEAAVKESKDRVRSALLNSQFEFPLRRITINLAPADLPKEGGRFDLAIALGVLAASGQLDAAACLGLEFVGELALTGELRPVRGILPSALSVRNAGRALVVPRDNAAEAALVDGQRKRFGAYNMLFDQRITQERADLHILDLACRYKTIDDLRGIGFDEKQKQASLFVDNT